MFSNNIVTTVTAAVSGEIAVGNKWQKAGNAIRAEFATAAGLDAVRPAFIEQVIIPALGKDAVAVMAVELPRKNSTDYAERCARDATYAAQWQTANEAKKTVRGTASVMYGRVRKYAYGADDKGPSEPRDLKTRLNEELAALVKACQKAESASFDIGATIRALEATLAVVNK